MRPHQQRAFTKVELLVILAVIGMVFVVLSPHILRRYAPAAKINCVNNMKNIGLAMRIFATEHNDKFPMQTSTNQGGVKEFMGDGKYLFRVFRSLSNELSTPKILACTSEPQIHAQNFQSLQNSNISYFVGVDAEEEYPERILGGDRNLRAGASNIQSGILSLTTNDFVEWTTELHTYNENVAGGNIVLADGSVNQTRNENLRFMLNKTGLTTNRFMLPD